MDVTLQHDRHNVLIATAEFQAQEVLALNPTLSAPFHLPPNATWSRA